MRDARHTVAFPTAAQRAAAYGLAVTHGTARNGTTMDDASTALAERFVSAGMAAM